MKRLAGALATLMGVAGCFPGPVSPAPVPTASAGLPSAPAAAPAGAGQPAVTQPLPDAPRPTPGSDGVAVDVPPTQSFQFEQPMDGAVVTRDQLVVLRGLPSGASFTMTMDPGSGSRPAALAPLAPGQMIWQLGDLPDGPYQLVADVRLPTGERGIARTHVRLFRRAGGGGGGGGGSGATVGPPSPITQPPLQPNAWADLAPLPQARAEVGGGAVGNRFVVFGGFGAGSNVTSDVFVFDATAATWQTSGSSMPTARTALCSAVAGGRIYAIGGIDSIFDPLTAVESYDPVSDSWIQNADLPSGRFYATAASLNGEVYAFGGLDGSWAELALTEHYDPVADTWTTAAPMPTARFGACAAALGGEIVVCGGSQGNHAIKTVEAYNPTTDQWRRLPDLPVSVAAGMAVSYAGRLYVFGGYDTAPLVSVWRFDPATNAWALHSVLQRDHIGGVAAAVGPKVYIAGGYNGIDAHTRFQVMTPLP